MWLLQRISSFIFTSDTCVNLKTYRSAVRKHRCIERELFWRKYKKFFKKVSTIVVVSSLLLPSFWCLYCYLWTTLHNSGPIVNFGQVITGTGSRYGTKANAFFLNKILNKGKMKKTFAEFKTKLWNTTIWSIEFVID